tara:strand:- start:2429 stop:3418 length:990 start_codon:yes stop_codon:yes gene_type:complete
MFASEVIREVDEAVVAFEFLTDRNELETASKRLSEAFFIGEYLPRIRTLDRQKKLKVQSFVRNADDLLNAMDVRDYKTANEIIDKLRLQAVDFNYSKAKAGIEFYTNMSNTSIAQAKIAAQKGNTDEYKKQMQMAIESWPLNPQIKEQNDLFASIADVQVTTLNELDTLLSQGNKREIMKNRGRFIAAVQNDKKRTDQLEGILNEVLLLEQQIAIIKGLNENNNPWGAWETAREAQGKFNDDNELLKLSVELSEKVSSFVRVIKRAEKLENEKHNGMSLTWYLKAKSIYPKSTYAKSGMNRLLNTILPADVENISEENSSEEKPLKLNF